MFITMLNKKAFFPRWKEGLKAFKALLKLF